MKKRIVIALYITLCLLCLSACGSRDEAEQDAAPETEEETAGDTDSEELPSGDKVLVAYFTRLPNTESGDDLDVVVQGGGPYGPIGDSYETADMDAISSASITITDEPRGNVETVARWIAEDTDGELFSIETEEKYPVNYDEVIEQGGVEQREGYRPELTTHVDNMEEYSVIYLGYPNWYNDMPMALYSFLEEYDLQGRTIVPFCTSAGSGFANTISTIQELEPNANVVEDGLALRMNVVKDSQADVAEWVNGLGL